MQEYSKGLYGGDARLWDEIAQTVPVLNGGSSSNSLLGGDNTDSAQGVSPNATSATTTSMQPRQDTGSNAPVAMKLPAMFGKLQFFPFAYSKDTLVDMAYSFLCREQFCLRHTNAQVCDDEENCSTFALLYLVLTFLGLRFALFDAKADLPKLI